MKTYPTTTLQVCLNLGLLALVSNAWSFPFWLDSPTRDNRHDPKSSLYSGSSNLPVAPPTSPVSHNTLVVDFEGSTPNDHTLWNGGGVITSVDSAGSTMNPLTPWAATDCVPPPGGNGSSLAACISGTMVMQNLPTVSPYASISLELTPGGGARTSSAPSVDVSSYAVHGGLKFDYRAGAVGVAYRILLVSPTITNQAYYEFDFTSANTAWNTVTVYFPGSQGASPNVFAQPSWNSTPVAFDKTKIGCINFEVIQQTSGPVNYSLCIDNVDFNVPAAPPEVYTCIMCFDGPDTSASDYSNNIVGTGAGINDNAGPLGNATTISGYGPGAIVAGSGLSGPYGTNNLAAHASGVVYPGGFAVMEIPFINGGYPYGPSSVDVTSYAVNQRVAFDFKGTAGVAFYFQYVTHNFTAPNHFNFYAYAFTPADANWHSYVIYFPGGSGSPKLSTYDACVGASPPCSNGLPPFDPTQSGEIEIGPLSVSSSTPYDFTIDNLRLN